MTILFWLYRSREDKSGKVSIQVRITYNGRRNIPTSLKIDPASWDQAKQKVKGSSELSKEYNTTLQNIRVKLWNVYNRLASEREAFTAEDIKQRYINKEAKKTLMSIYEVCMDKKRILAEHGKGSLNTLKNYTSSKNKLSKFLIKQYNKEDVYLYEVNENFIEAFDLYMRTHEPMHQNGIIKQMQTLSSVLKYCSRKGLIKEDPFSDYDMSLEETDQLGLFPDELIKWENVELNENHLSETRDAFLFCCYTAMAFIDYKAFCENGEVETFMEIDWVVDRRVKSSTKYVVPLLSKASKLLKKYEHHYNETGRRLPIKSSQRMNDDLKVIARKAKIDKRLTFHKARHTFGTTVALLSELDLRVVMKIMGHKSIKSTMKYTHVFNDALIKAKAKMDKALE